MSDPITFTASAIASLAFQKAIEAAGSETGKKFTASAYELINTLREKIWGKFKGHDAVEAELVKADAGDSESIETVGDYLKIAMKQDPDFATAIQQLAHQIDLCVVKDNNAPTQVNYGNQNKQVNTYGGENIITDSVTINK